MSAWLRAALLAASLLCTAADAQQTQQQLALAWQDHILRIAVARQQLTADQADAQLQAFGKRVPSAPDADQVHALRQELDEAFEGWLSAIEAQAATTSNWPSGRSAADWRLLVQVNLAQLRDAMLNALVSDQDPLATLQKTAQVDGWTRGEQLSDAPLSGHAERVSALLTSKPLPPTSKPPKDPRVAPVTLQRLHFDQFQVGPLPSDAFARAGVRVVARDGVAGVYASDASMVLPAGRSQVLLVAGDRMTSLTFEFDAPIRRFSLTRIGTARGASVPTWIIRAFDSAGAVVGVTGNVFGLPESPQQFSVNGVDIVRVVLSTDNRNGEGTLATWNSLPVAEFEFEQ